MNSKLGVSMKNRILVGLLSLSGMFFLNACGSDGGNSSTTNDVGVDVEDTSIDVDVDVTPDTNDPDTDTDTETDTTEDADVDENLCPDSVLCLDDRTGQPSFNVCLEEGYPEGTICTPMNEVACCVRPFVCESDEQCETIREEDNLVCTDSRYPCVCATSGECVVSMCSSALDCESEDECIDGLCQDPDATIDYIARITTSPTMMLLNASMQMNAVAVDPENVNVTHPSLAIDWSASSGTISSSGLYTADGDLGEVTIEARVFSNASDLGDQVVLEVTQEDENRRVFVIDETTRLPIIDALVLIESGDDSEEISTDSAGQVSFDFEGEVNIHVFAEDHQIISAINVSANTTLLPTSPVQRAAIQEVRDGFVCPDDAYIDTQNNCGEPGEAYCLCYDLHNVDVVNGEPSFEEVAGNGELWISLNGMALGNNLLDLNFDLLIGPSIERLLPDSSPIMGGDTVDMPSGVTLHFNTEPMVGSFVATAPEGERTLWSIGGLISLSRNPNLITDLLSSSGGEVEISKIVAALLPLFEDFYSGVVTGLEMEQDGTFPVRDPGLGLTVPTRRHVEFEPPSMPTVDGVWADTGVFLAGVMLPGEGLVPLGITAGVDSSGEGDVEDGLLDGNTDTLDVVDPLHIAVAPMHSGINTSTTRYMMASVALFLSNGGSGATSGILTVLDEGEPLPETLDLEVPFPTFAEGSSWTAETRTVEIVPPSTGADLYRVVFSGAEGESWIVYTPAETLEIALPNVPEGFTDYAAIPQDPSVIALSVHQPNVTDYQTLLEPNGTNLSALFEFVHTFSVYEIPVLPQE